MPTDPAIIRIAEGLTKAQRAIFAQKPRRCFCGRQRVDTTDYVGGGYLHGLYHCYILPGLAVRTYLQESEG